MSKRNKELEDAVAALRPEMIAALQRLIRKPSVEASPLPGKPFSADVDACFTEALTLCHELGFETTKPSKHGIIKLLFCEMRRFLWAKRHRRRIFPPKRRWRSRSLTD